METTKQPIIIKKETVMRLIKDVKQLKGHPLSGDNIYYYHDEENMMRGYALIIGTIDTPYFGGYYLFTLNYPEDYPHSPPNVTYLTNGDNIRFNPNLYINGKVCISLLNTWRGEQWTSCQTINSVLLTLATLLCNDPLVNEPGIRKGHQDCENYSRIIEYKNIDIAILNILDDNSSQCSLSQSQSQSQSQSYFSNIQNIIQLFRPIMLENFSTNRIKLLSFLEEKKINTKPRIIKTMVYDLNVFVDYNKLYDKFSHISNKILLNNK